MFFENYKNTISACFLTLSMRFSVLSIGTLFFNLKILLLSCTPTITLNDKNQVGSDVKLRIFTDRKKRQQQPINKLYTVREKACTHSVPTKA